MEKKLKNNFIFKNKTIRDAFVLLNKNARRCLIVVDKNNKLLGTLTDGDIRKYLLKGFKLDSSIKDIYNKNCFFLKRNEISKKKISSIFYEKKVEVLPVINKSKIVEDVFYVHDFNKNSVLKSEKKNLKCDLIIMAGGYGKRLKPFTEVLPKPLIPIGNIPIISIIIKRFSIFGIKNIYLSLNYKSEIVKAYIKNSKISNKIKFISEKFPLGTCGSLSILNKKIKDSLIVSNCDVLLDIDYYDLLDIHKKKKNDMTIVVAVKKFTIPYGSCEIDKKGQLKNIREKPASEHLISTGLYILEPKILKFIPKKRKMDFDELIKILKLKKLKIGIYPVDDNLWTDVGQWDQYREALKKFNNEKI